MGTFNYNGGEVAVAREVARWSTAASNAFSLLWLGEAVMFTDFHEHGFTILVSDFLRGLLREHEIQLQHLTPT